jgi:acyl carrier protein
MNDSAFIEQINKIFIDVLDNEDIVITGDTNANDVEEWDSLSHIQLVVAIEKHFKVKFLASEMHTWKNVNDMIECIKSKMQ